jgi:hypothetical protein
LPEVVEALARWGRTPDEVCRRVDRAMPSARLGALLFDLAASAAPAAVAFDKRAQQQVEAVLRRLKMRNLDLDVAGRVVGVAGAVAGPPPSPATTRRLLSAVGRKAAAEAVAAWAADGAARQVGEGTALGKLGEEILQAGAPLAVGELAITGADLMAELGIPAGERLGRKLRALLDASLDGEVANERDALLALARALVD